MVDPIIGVLLDGIMWGAPSYQREVDRRLDAGWKGLRIRTEAHTKAALDKIVDEIIADIRAGKLKPYDHKRVNLSKL